MKNIMLNKELVLGIIFLFLCAGVLPSISGSLTEPKSTNNKQSFLYLVFLFGIISPYNTSGDLEFYAVNVYIFAINLLYLQLELEHLTNEVLDINWLAEYFHGIMTDHFICGFIAI
jgi:hypothetical protein